MGPPPPPPLLVVLPAVPLVVVPLPEVVVPLPVAGAVAGAAVTVSWAEADFVESTADTAVMVTAAGAGCTRLASVSDS